MEIVDKRYMFDTSALNRIVRSPDAEMLIYRSKPLGYEYYFTEIQVDEAIGSISKSRPGIPRDMVERSRAEFAVNMLKTIIKLQTQYVGQIATLRLDRWVLDGTFTFLPDDEQTADKLFDDILQENDNQHYNDAMIGMTAITYGCVLVVDDKRFFRKVNHAEPGRAISYSDFIASLSASCATLQ